MTLASGGSNVPACGSPASSAVTPAGSVHKFRSDNVVPCGCSCDVCECYRGGIVVMDVIWRRLCLNII